MLPEIEIVPRVKRRPLVHENITLGLFFADLTALTLSFVLAWHTSPLIKDLIAPDLYARPLEDYRHIHDLFFIWMCPIVMYLFFIKGHYTQRVPWWSQAQHILVICVIAYIIDGFTRFALDMSFSRLLIGLSWLYVFVLALFLRQLLYIVSRKRGIWTIPTIVIGDIDTVANTLYAFAADHYTGYDVKSIYLRDSREKPFEITSIPKKFENIEIHREIVDYQNLIINNIDSFFVVSLETFRGQDRDEIINALSRLNALYAVIPPMSRMSMFDMEPRYFFGHDVMLLHAKNSIYSPVAVFFKRAMDIGASGTALLALSPLFLAVMICLKLEGQSGSVFYGGKRIGRYGKRFKCWKFQSMEPNSDHLLLELLEREPTAKAEWEEFRKLKSFPDPRVNTKTARLIRKTSIDELPQLWNVFIGDMSIVGPRPILENEVDLFGTSINEYLTVRPGITGVWQVSGRNETSFQRRVYWDSWYVRNWSFWGDIVIIIKTLRVVLGGSGAY